MEDHLVLPASVRVLTNADLLHAIFALDEVNLEPSARRQTLLACTTVCRTFYESAVRFLWSNLEQFWPIPLPLWHLLAPSNLSFPFGYTQEPEDILPDYLQKVGAAQLYLDPIRWDRFLWHASLVRRILLKTSRNVWEAARPFMQGIVMQNGGKPILPLLRTIRWIVYGPVPDDAFAVFCGPTLFHAAVNLSGYLGETVIGRFFVSLRESSPFLERFSVNINQGNRTLQCLYVIQEVVLFAHLREVHIFPAQAPDGFLTLVTNTNTTFARSKVPDLLLTPQLDPVISARHLRKLSIHGNVPLLRSTFQNICFPALQSVDMSIYNERGLLLEQKDVTAVLAVFYQSVSQSHFLDNFDLEVSVWPVPRPGDEQPLRKLLAPILTIDTLRSFRFRQGILTTLGDADLHVMASAWPKLKILNLQYVFPSTSGISIDALHYVRTHCANLVELSVPLLYWPLIGVHPIPLPPSRPDVDVDQPDEAHPLQYLKLSTGYGVEHLPPPGAALSDEGAEAMAQYLLALFPRLGWDPAGYATRLRQAYGDERSLRPGLFDDDQWSRVVRHMVPIGLTCEDGLLAVGFNGLEEPNEASRRRWFSLFLQTS